MEWIHLLAFLVDVRTYQPGIVLYRGLREQLHKCVIQFAHLKWNCVFKKLIQPGVIWLIALQDHFPEVHASHGLNYFTEAVELKIKFQKGSLVFNFTKVN